MSLTQSTRTGAVEQATETEQETPSDGVLSLLDAEYTLRILEAIRTEAKPARDVAEECGASRPTVYRRLNRLREAGLVDTAMSYDADGHHRTVFEATLEALSVDVTEDGLAVTVTTNGAGASPPRPSRPVSAD
jgi:DNA-binding transcriptional ArsR family regulator